MIRIISQSEAMRLQTQEQKRFAIATLNEVEKAKRNLSNARGEVVWVELLSGATKPYIIRKMD